MGQGILQNNIGNYLLPRTSYLAQFTVGINRPALNVVGIHAPPPSGGAAVKFAGRTLTGYGTSLANGTLISVRRKVDFNQVGPLQYLNGAYDNLLYFPAGHSTAVDVTPWVHWRLPTILNKNSSAVDGGPVLVTVEYDVEAERETGFLQPMHKYERIRRRDGAYRWGVFRDIENPNRYLETFLVVSWAEHLRQHQRSTRADRDVEERVHRCIRGTSSVRHLVYTIAKS